VEIGNWCLVCGGEGFEELVWNRFLGVVLPPDAWSGGIVVFIRFGKCIVIGEICLEPYIFEWGF